MYPVAINQNLEQILETVQERVIEYFNSLIGSFSLSADSKNYRADLEKKISNIKNIIRQAQNEGIKKKCHEVQQEADELFRQITSEFVYPVIISQNLEQMLDIVQQRVIEYFNSLIGSFSLSANSNNYRGELEKKISNIKNIPRQAQSEGIKRKCLEVQKEAEELFR